MNYNHLTKQQLIQYVEDLEDLLDEAVKKLETESFQAKVDQIKEEAVLLGKDVLKVVQFVYELGVKTGSQFHALVAQLKANDAPQLGASPVLNPLKEFPY